jgi:hypothetical protein
VNGEQEYGQNQDNMKILLVSFLLCLYGYGKAQPAQRSSGDPVVYYIDSQRVNSHLFYIDPASISNINLANGFDKNGHKEGRMYITLKTPRPKFLTLKDISDKQAGNDLADILYIIDDSVIQDTTGVRIDPSYILHIKFDSTADKKYLSSHSRQMQIVLIGTKAQLNKPDPSKGPSIHIH